MTPWTSTGCNRAMHFVSLSYKTTTTNNNINNSKSTHFPGSNPTQLPLALVCRRVVRSVGCAPGERAPPPPPIPQGAAHQAVPPPRQALVWGSLASAVPCPSRPTQQWPKRHRVLCSHSCGEEAGWRQRSTRAARTAASALRLSRLFPV